MKTKFSAILMAIIATVTLFSACKKDDSTETISKEDTQKVQTLLKEVLVLDSNIEVNGRTVTPKPMPTKYYFSVMANSSTILSVQIKDLKIGKMPYTVNFNANCTLTIPTSLDKQGLGEGSWIKFSCDNATVELSPTIKNNNATLIGFLNLATEQIKFKINFNMQNVLCEVPLQKINPNRLALYDKELEEFNKNLQTTGGRPQQ